MLLSETLFGLFSAQVINPVVCTKRNAVVTQNTPKKRIHNGMCNYSDFHC